jgi:RND family efflux transporter MFP subunit
MTTISLKRLLTVLGAVALWLPAAGSADELSEFDCVIEPSMVVELSSNEDGVLEQVLVDRGERVEANQKLAKLESSLEEASLNYARERSEMTAEIRLHKASLAYGVKNQKRISDLQEKKLVSHSEGDRARTETKIERYKMHQALENKRLAELELARTTETLKRHTIHSPIDGVVVERYLNPGESVEDRPILKLAQIDPLRVEVVLPVDRFGKIQVGQAATIHPEAGIGGEFQSTVSTVDPVLDAASGTFRVRLMLPNPDHALTSGLRCKIQFGKQSVAADSKKPSNVRMAGK